MPTIYSAKEREPTTIPIVDVLRDGEIDIYLNVQRREYFDITFRGDRLTVTAGKYIGLIPLNERIFVQVEPKMPILNLVRILSAVGGDVVQLDVLEREYETSGTRPPAILEAIADAFAISLRQVEVDGLTKQYVRQADGGSSLKGQIQFAPSVQAHWSRGRRHVAICEFSELTSDTPENRLLRYACHLLLTHHRLTGLPRKSVRSLAEFEEFFALSRIALERPEESSITADVGGVSPAYRRANRLAKAIISERGVELPGSGGDLSLPSFLINMETLFERYARHVLQVRLSSFTVLDGNTDGKKPLFDDRRIPAATPDILIRDDSGSSVLVGEVKYKADDNRDDINQVLAYALAYRVSKVVLVLPADVSRPAGLGLVGKIGGVSVYRYRVNMATNDLETEEREFAETVGHLLTPQVG